VGKIPVVAEQPSVSHEQEGRERERRENEFGLRLGWMSNGDVRKKRLTKLGA
jgi:hypothetical protein